MLSPARIIYDTVELRSGQKRFAMTLYGVYRDANQMVIAPPDFFLDDGFQV
jgi:hypothetical protein